MLNHSPLLRALATGFAIVFVLNCASTVLAQSGRRVRKSTPAAESTPEPTPTPTPSTASDKQKPRLTFLVGLDRFGGFSNIPSYASDGVLQSLAERLGKAPGIHVGATRSDMSHIDAIRTAKAEKEGYVVWIQLEIDTMGSNNGNNGNLDDVVVEYTVLAPTTAKVAMSGRAYPPRRGVILAPRTSSVYGDRYLNQAAQDAADKILAHFQLHMPTNRRP